MDKKFICAVILVILAFVMCSCSDNAENSDSQSTSSSHGKTSSVINNSQSKYTDFKNSTSDTNSSFEISEKDILVMANADSFIINPQDDDYDVYRLVAYIRDGVKNKTFDISCDEFDNLPNSKNILAKEYYSKDSTEYESLGNDIIFKYVGNLKIIYNNVKYTDYFKDETALPQQSWIDHFKIRMADERETETDTPIIIKESWTSDYAGKEIAIVRACNVIYSNDRTVYSRGHTDYSTWENLENLPKAVLPAGENHIIYDMVSIFLDGDVIYKAPIYEEKVFCKPLSGKNSSEWVGVSFARPEDDTTFNFKFYSFQCDNLNNVIKCPVFVDHMGDLGTQGFINPTLYAIFDIDNNQKMNILRYNALSLMYTGRGPSSLLEIE